LRDLTKNPQIHDEYKIVYSLLDFYDDYCVFIFRFIWRGQDVDVERKETESLGDGSRERKRRRENERQRKTLNLSCVRHFGKARTPS